MALRTGAQVQGNAANDFDDNGGTFEELMDAAATEHMRRARARSTIQNHQVILNAFVEFARALPDLSLFPGNPAKPEDVIKEGAGDAKNRVLHPFFHFKAKSSHGHISERSSLSTLKTQVETFAAANRITTGCHLPQSAVISIKAYLADKAKELGIKDVNEREANA
jgi:hypothetical protein